MTERMMPRMAQQEPRGFFEALMGRGQHLPGKLGFICYRKLKRRYRWRNEHVFDQVLADLGPGDLCIDLGANMGEITAKMAQSGAQVISFEPDPDTFDILARDMGAMPNVTLHRAAAGVRAGRLPMRRSARLSEDYAKYSQAASLVRDDAGMDPGNTVEVEVIDFPDFLSALNRDVRVLKMDIEGSEWELMEALLGADVLSRIDCIFVETHEWMDPDRYMPMAARMQAEAERLDRPYINLFWH